MDLEDSNLIAYLLEDEVSVDVVVVDVGHVHRFFGISLFEFQSRHHL